MAMGSGIWSMHYIGMLAYSLPVAVFYDWPTVLLSLVAAVLASAVALFVVSRNKMGLLSICTGGLLMGTGIAAMHYIGMDAMRLAAMCNYSPGTVALSLALAIVISLVALWLTFHLRSDLGTGGLAQAFQRLSNGGSYSGDALHRHGRGDVSRHGAAVAHERDPFGGNFRSWRGWPSVVRRS